MLYNEYIYVCSCTSHEGEYVLLSKYVVSALLIYQGKKKDGLITLC